MTWYFLFPLFLIFIITNGYKKKGIGFFVLFLLFFFSAFRGENVGHDTSSYMNWDGIKARANFELSLEHEDIGAQVEIISNLFNAFVYYNDLPPRSIIFIYSLFTIVFWGIAVRKFNTNIAFASLFYVLLTIYYFSLAAARQICAASFILLAYSYLQNSDKKKYYFFIYILIAFFIHSYSIFCILLYPITRLKLNRRLIGLCIYLICVFFILIRIDLLTIISNYLDSDKVNMYLFYYNDDSNIISSKAKVFFLIQYTIFYYIFCKNNAEEYTNSCDMLFLASILLSTMMLSYNGIIGRIHYNLSIFQCVYLAKFYITNKHLLIKKDFYIYCILIILLLYNTSQYGLRGALTTGYYLCF